MVSWIISRFLEFGWDRVTIEDMNRIYDHFLDKFELVRIQVGLLKLLPSFYQIFIAL